MQKLKIVVTGASGFLGGFVLRTLASQQNVEVIAVTRKEISGWCAVSDYSQAPEGDVLIHLAEDNDRAQVAKSGQAYEEQVETTLAALLAKGYCRVIYASSAVLYGNDNPGANFPNDPVHVHDTYTRVKRQSELAVLNSPSGIVVRLANIYGPNMSLNNVMSTILNQITEESPLQVMDTNPVCDFIWVEDAAEGIVTLALNNVLTCNEGGLYNLGTGVGTSIGALAAMALEIAGQPDRLIKSKHLSERKSNLILDFSDTLAACGWRPKTSLQQGMTHLIKTMEESV